MCNEFKFKSDFFCPAKLSESDSSKIGVKNQSGHNLGEKNIISFWVLSEGVLAKEKKKKKKSKQKLPFRSLSEGKLRKR